MKRFSVASLLFGSALTFALPTQAALYITIVEGLGGTPEYAERFDEQREQVEAASFAISDENHVTTFFGEDATREALLAHFTTLKSSMGNDDRAAIYLIGHGSFDGDTYKFNIPGPDITGTDLNEVLTTLPGNNHFLLNTSSTSGAMLEVIGEEEGFILISATRNGNERNSTEFGTYFAEALNSSEADVNKNNNISIQEAFDYADRKVTDFYASAGKLATEHPQLRGEEQAAAFTIGTVRARQVASENTEIAELQARQREIDDQIETLQLNRSQYSNTEYTTQLRALVLESAEVLEQLDALEEEGSGNN